MRRSKLITFNGREITAKELTVAEIADCVDAVAAGAADLLDLMFPGALPSEAVVRSAGIPRPELHALAPSELDALWQEVAGLNPFFLRMIEGRPGPAAAPPVKAPATSSKMPSRP